MSLLFRKTTLRIQKLCGKETARRGSPLQFEKWVKSGFDASPPWSLKKTPQKVSPGATFESYRIDIFESSIE